MKLIEKRDRSCDTCAYGGDDPLKCFSRERGFCLALATPGTPGWTPERKRGRPTEYRCAEFNRKLPCSSCPEFCVESRECLLRRPAEEVKNKYQRVIRSETVDVYDVLQAFNVINPALQHLIKKALCAGLRGHKDRKTDMEEILSAAKRALELETNNGES